MEREDKIIKSHLEGALNDKKPCLESERLADYIAGNLSKNALADIEGHIAVCKECLDKISMAAKAGALWKNGQLAPASQTAISKATDITAKKRAGKNPKRHIWLLAAMIAFMASFVFPRYFIQCLVATILLGVKWIVESENVRTLILVLDSWRKHQHDYDEEISQRLKERGNINGTWYQPSKKD
jgi:hypothetical protein